MQDSLSRMCGVAHDIRNVLARAMLAAEQWQHHVDGYVSAEAARIGEAIDQVTQICRRESARAFPSKDADELTSDCISDLLQHVVNLARIQGRSDKEPVDFHVSVAEDVTLEADAPSVFRIAFNLVQNAVKAIANQGGSRIDVLVVRFGPLVQIGVIDDGPGLPDHVMNFLFPHLSDKSPAGQIGVGLVTAASLAADLEGHLDLVDTSDSGTHFVVTLPASSAVLQAGESPRTRRVIARSLIEAF